MENGVVKCMKISTKKWIKVSKWRVISMLYCDILL